MPTTETTFETTSTEPAPGNPWQTLQTWRTIVVACLLTQAVCLLLIAGVIVTNAVRMEFALLAIGNAMQQKR